MPPRCRTAADLARALSWADPAGAARARAEAEARPIAYPLGSGQAEEVALLAGLKPAIRQRLDPADQAAARRRFERLGFAVTAGVPYRTLAGKGLDGKPRFIEGSVVLIGRDAERLRQIEAMERAIYDGPPKLGDRYDRSYDIEEGRLLGYPRCCVEAFAEVPPEEGNPSAFAAALARTRGAPRPRLNVLDLGIFHYVPWIPCSFDCELSLRYADAVAARVGARHGAFVERVDAALSAHRLMALEAVQVSLTGRVEGRRALVERAWPTARDRHPDARRDGDAADAAARLSALVSARGSVEVDGDVILAGGEPVARCPKAMLVPFGLGATAG